MAGGTRCTVVVLTLLLLSSIPFVAADEPDEVSLLINDQSSTEKSWFVEGDVVSLLPSFVNAGGPIALENDPSCDVVLQVYDS